MGGSRDQANVGTGNLEIEKAEPHQEAPLSYFLSILNILISFQGSENHGLRMRVCILILRLCKAKSPLRKRMNKRTVQESAELLNQNPSTSLIDLRTFAEFGSVRAKRVSTTPWNLDLNDFSTDQEPHSYLPIRWPFDEGLSKNRGRRA